MIPQYEPQVRWSYAWAVAKQLLTGWVGPGKQTWEFEQYLAQLSGRTYAIATTSGTTALLLALKALDLKPGANVLFPAYTFLAGANAAKFLGYNVVLADVSLTTGCMDVSPQLIQDIKAKLVDAVIYVDHNGCVQDADLCDLYDTCRAAGVPLIEDASQALGAAGAGSYGDMSVFSFSPPKLITTGQGGAVVTNDEKLRTRIGQWQDHGGGWRGTRIHDRIGLNFKFNDLAAAYGNAQFRIFNQLRAKRRLIWTWYRSSLPLGVGKIWNDSHNSRWCVIYKTQRAQSICSYLSRFEIQATQYYKAVHHNPPFAYTDKDAPTFPHAEELANELVYLPSSLTLTQKQVKHICHYVCRWWEANQ